MKLDSFKNMNVKSCKICTHNAVPLMSLSQFSENSQSTSIKGRAILHSEASYRKITPAMRKFKKMKAFARFRNEIWCMDLAYIYELAKDNKGVNYY